MQSMQGRAAKGSPANKYDPYNNRLPRTVTMVVLGEDHLRAEVGSVGLSALTRQRARPHYTVYVQGTRLHHITTPFQVRVK